MTAPAPTAPTASRLNHLATLESEAIHIVREMVAELEDRKSVV